MVETRLARWRFWTLYAVLALAVAFLRLLPIDAGTPGLPGPDLILAVAFAWVIRRPDYVPVLLVALVMLAADVLFYRPLGLWAAASVIGLEFLRSRAVPGRDMPFLFEWALVAAVVALMTLGTTAILALVLATRPALSLVFAEMMATILVYPLVAWLSSRALGIRRPTGAPDMGARA